MAERNAGHKWNNQQHKAESVEMRAANSSYDEFIARLHSMQCPLQRR